MSWVISVADRRFLHAGDTLWHGQWRRIGAQYGPFDAAFLPINGARVEQRVRSEISSVMTPEQAVDAAVLLRAGLLVPIHFGLNDPPFYVEVDDPVRAMEQASARRDVSSRRLRPGETLQLENPDAR